MSYQLPRAGGKIPYVTAVENRDGLGQSQPAPLVATSEKDPVGFRLAETLGRPILAALSSRIAYGQTPGAAYYPSGFGVQTPTGFYGGGAFGGFDPRTILLIGGAGLLALMLMRR